MLRKWKKETQNCSYRSLDSTTSLSSLCTSALLLSPPAQLLAHPDPGVFHLASRSGVLSRPTQLHYLLHTV